MDNSGSGVALCPPARLPARPLPGGHRALRCAARTAARAPLLLFAQAKFSRAAPKLVASIWSPLFTVTCFVPRALPRYL